MKPVFECVDLFFGFRLYKGSLELFSVQCLLFQLPESSDQFSSEKMFKIFVLFAVLACAYAQECGKVGNVNVTDANNALPWQVQLKERSTNEVFCTGTLISNRHVLVGMTCQFLASKFSSTCFQFQFLISCTLLVAQKLF